jgi:hypothetical protein
LLIVFKNVLEDSTNAFKWAEITLNKSKTIYLIVFYLFFHTRPRTLLPDHVYSRCWQRHCSSLLWILFENKSVDTTDARVTTVPLHEH